MAEINPHNGNRAFIGRPLKKNDMIHLIMFLEHGEYWRERRYKKFIKYFQNPLDY